MTQVVPIAIRSRLTLAVKLILSIRDRCRLLSYNLHDSRILESIHHLSKVRETYEFIYVQRSFDLRIQEVIEIKIKSNDIKVFRYITIAHKCFYPKLKNATSSYPFIYDLYKKKRNAIGGSDNPIKS